MALDANPVCPVCGGGECEPFAEVRDEEFFTSDELFCYRRCLSCEAVYLDPPPTERLAEIYPPNYYSFEGGPGSRTFVQAVKELLDVWNFKRLLAGIPGDALRVLDVGGGSGWLLGLVRRASPRVTETHALDVREDARQAAEAAGHVFHCTRVEEFSTDRRFDLILLLNVIEHVADPGAVLRSMREMLTADGCILVKTPNTDTLDRRIFQHRGWGGFHCPRHWVLFTMPGFQRLAEQCGLECATAAYTQAGPQWASSAIQALTRAGWLETSAERPVFSHPLFMGLAALGATFDFLRRPFAPTAQMFLTLRRPH
jgi:SAM-dependent methyltransferase